MFLSLRIVGKLINFFIHVALAGKLKNQVGGFETDPKNLAA